MAAPGREPVDLALRPQRINPPSPHDLPPPLRRRIGAGQLPHRVRIQRAGDRHRSHARHRPLLRRGAGGGAHNLPRDRDPHPRRLRLGSPRTRPAGQCPVVPVRGGRARLAVRRRRRRAAGALGVRPPGRSVHAAARRRRDRGRKGPAHRPPHAGTHAGAPLVPGHRYRGVRSAGGPGERRLHFRRRRRPSRPPRAGGARGGHDGGRGTPALRLAPARQATARSPAALAGTRRGVGLRQGARRDAAIDPRLRTAGQSRLPRDRRRMHSSPRCCASNRSRRGTSRG